MTSCFLLHPEEPDSFFAHRDAEARAARAGHGAALDAQRRVSHVFRKIVIGDVESPFEIGRETSEVHDRRRGDARFGDLAGEVDVEIKGARLEL